MDCGLVGFSVHGISMDKNTGGGFYFLLLGISLTQGSNPHTYLGFFNLRKYRNHPNQFSSVVSHSLRPHGLQHTSLPCPSPTPGAYSNSCLSSQWCHPTISSSVIAFSSCLQSFPESGSFQMSQLFSSGGQSIGVSASTSVLPVNTQDWKRSFWML